MNILKNKNCNIKINDEEIPIELYRKTNNEFVKYVRYDDYKKLENIIKEVREWAKKYSCQFTNDDGELVVSEISFNIQARPCDLLKILDKEKDNE